MFDHLRQLAGTPCCWCVGFLLYFTAASKQHGCQCIGVARSRSPGGPYESAGSEPLVAAPEQGGAIDPDVFVAPDGRCPTCSLAMPRRSS